MELDLTSHVFRHMVARAVQVVGGVDVTRRTLSHRRKSSTRYYLSKRIPSHIQAVLFDGPPINDSDVLRATSSAAIADPAMPRGLTDEQLEEVLGSPECESSRPGRVPR